MNPSVKFFQSENLLYDYKHWKDHKRAAEELTGTSVMTTYKPRVYTISGVDFEKNPKTKFSCTSEGLNETLSYEKYILKTYQLECTDLAQPLLRIDNKRTGQSIYLIPEF